MSTSVVHLTIREHGDASDGDSHQGPCRCPGAVRHWPHSSLDAVLQRTGPISQWQKQSGERGPCTSLGQQDGASPGVRDVGELARGHECERTDLATCLPWGSMDAEMMPHPQPDPQPYPSLHLGQEGTGKPFSPREHRRTVPSTGGVGASPPTVARRADPGVIKTGPFIGCSTLESRPSTLPDGKGTGEPVPKGGRVGELSRPLTGGSTWEMNLAV